MTATGTVVVGADGSPAARTAIEYALQDAERRGARLRIVAAAPLPQYWADSYSMTAVPAPEEIKREMRTAARRQLEEVRRARPELAMVPVTIEAATGAPGPVLLDRPEAPICSCSATAAVARRAAPCSGRSGCTASSTRAAR